MSGISQRDYTQYYDHISKQKEEICRCIQDFFKKHIQYKFLDEDCEYFLLAQWNEMHNVTEPYFMVVHILKLDSKYCILSILLYDSMADGFAC